MKFIRNNHACSVKKVVAPMLCISERWKSKTEIEVAVNVLGFPLLKGIDVTWLGKWKEGKCVIGNQNIYDVVWAFESPNFQSFKRGVGTKKKKRIRGYSLAYGRVASQKNEMSLKMFRIKTLKKTYFMYWLLGKYKLLATEELSPKYHGKKHFIFHCWMKMSSKGNTA